MMIFNEIRGNEHAALPPGVTDIRTDLHWTKRNPIPAAAIGGVGSRDPWADLKNVQKLVHARS